MLRLPRRVEWLLVAGLLATVAGDVVTATARHTASDAGTTAWTVSGARIPEKAQLAADDTTVAVWGDDGDAVQVYDAVSGTLRCTAEVSTVTDVDVVGAHVLAFVGRLSSLDAAQADPIVVADEVIAYDETTCRRVWIRSFGHPVDYPPLEVAGRMIFSASLASGQVIEAMDPVTGKSMWVKRFPRSPHQVLPDLGAVVAGNHLDVLAPGIVEQLDARTGQQVGSVPWAASRSASPNSVERILGEADGLVIVESDSRVEALHADGRTAWSLVLSSVGSTIGGVGAYLHGDVVAASAFGGPTTFYDAASGHELWGGPVLFPFISMVDGDRVLVGYSNAVVAQDIHTGHELWRTSTAGDIVSTVGSDGVLLVSSQGMAEVDVRDGSTLWRGPPVGALQDLQAAVSNRAGLVVIEDGGLVAIRTR